MKPNTNHLLFSFGLFALLFGVYFMTYKGAPISGDELALFSGTESIVKYQEARIYSAFFLYPGDWDTPWLPLVHEPLQIIVDVPLYWVAWQSGVLGMLHTVWFSNALIIAALGVLLYWAGILEGYRRPTAAGVALLVGVATMLLPYSQTHFREPLAAFWALLAVVLARRLSRKWRWQTALLTLAVGVAALLTKEAMYLLLPTLVMLAAPTGKNWRYSTARMLGMVGGVLLLTLALAPLVQTVFGTSRLGLEGYLDRFNSTSLDYFLTVAGAYLISPGHSLLALNPVLLLAFYGSYRLLQQGEKRLAAAPWVFWLTLTLGYGVGGWDWHGGLGWGTRYLLPVVPMMGLLLLPFVDAVLQRRLPRWTVISGASLVIFSLSIQLGGVLVRTQNYFETLDRRFAGEGIDAYFKIGTWQLQQTQWFVSLSLLDWDTLPIAWRYAEPAWVGGLLGGALILLGGGGMHRASQSTSVARAVWGAVPLGVVLAMGIGIYTLRQDPRMFADRPALHALLTTVEDRATAQDIIFLDSPEYKDFFMNFYRGSAPLVTLPYSFGERYSPNEPEPVVVDQDGDGRIAANERLDGRISRARTYIMGRYQNLWLVTDKSPFHSWAYRPVEDEFTLELYPVETLEFSETARLLRLLPQTTINYPSRVTPQTPFEFAEQVALVGYDVQASAQVGGVLPLTLLWSPLLTMETDYNIGVFLINSDGALVSARNGPPQASFGATSRWEVGGSYLENHGLPIPNDLPPGSYRVQVVMYDWRNAERLPVYQNGERIAGDYAQIAAVQILAGR